MTTTSETQGLVEQFDPAALALAAAAPDPAAPEAPAPSKRSSRKSVLALSVCALAINGSAAIYTLPFDAALKDIQSAQQQHTASLQENNHALQQNAALLQQDSMVLLSLRQSITDERFDAKKISSQLSTLIAKVDSLQSAMMSDVTSSIRRAHARYGLSAVMRKRMARQSKSVGPISVGGAPLTVPATISAPES